MHDFFEREKEKKRQLFSLTVCVCACLVYRIKPIDNRRKNRTSKSKKLALVQSYRLSSTMATPTNSHGPATSPMGRIKCYLCEVPRGPWAMVYDFVEPVCRACCNFEGIDRIGEVLDKARQLRRTFEPHQVPNHGDHGSRSPHEIPVAAITGAPSRPIAAQSPTAAYQILSRGPLNGLNGGKVVVTSNGKFAFPPPHSLGPLTAQTTAIVPTTSTNSMTGPARLAFPMHKPVPMEVHHPQIDTTQRFAQIQQTLNDLSKSPPFRVRFSKDHSLIGRVIAFDAVCRGSDYELKVFVEYPIGSGNVFQSASGAGRQMYGEFRERLGIGGGFRGASSNGYKDLEFEKVHGDENWKVLGELLTEEVRFFRGSVKKDLLPQPYVDSMYPYVPPANMSSTRGFLKNNLLNRKRKASHEDENDPNKKPKPTENGSTSSHDEHHPITSPSAGASSPKVSPASPNAGGSPRQMVSPRTEHSLSPAESPRSPEHHHHSNTNGISSPHHSVSEVDKPPTEQMECMICHRALDDTRFVQCPSVSMHKFCFSCSRESIKQQVTTSKDVYCPSKLKCLVQGSTTPWAFMEQEIATILKSES